MGATTSSEKALAGEKAARIVDAMRTSVAQRGVAGSTFDHVAKQAGVSRGLLHYYFGTKERLLTEVVRRDALPVEAEQLRPEQRGYLRALADAAIHGDAPATGEQWQAAIFAVSQEHGLDAKAAFNALYFSFLGRPNGPRAGWLLASLERDFVIRRLTEAGAAGEGSA